MSAPALARTAQPREAAAAQTLHGHAAGGAPRGEALALQRMAGNAAVSGLIQRSAEGVCPTCGRRGRGTCPGCGRPFTPVRRAAAHGAGMAPGALDGVRQVLGSGGGQPLHPTTRDAVGERFGRDFSDVRVHTDARAAASARALGAHAYTVGRHVVFAQGAFQPATTAGMGLLGHELAHVIQQRGAAPDLGRLALDGDVASPAEREADAAGAAVAAGRSTPALTARPTADVLPKFVYEPSGGCGFCMGAQFAGTRAHRIVQNWLIHEVSGLEHEFPLEPEPDDETPPPKGSALDLADRHGHRDPDRRDQAQPTTAARGRQEAARRLLEEDRRADRRPAPTRQDRSPARPR